MNWNFLLMNWLEMLLLSVQIAARQTEGPMGPKPKPLQI